MSVLVKLQGGLSNQMFQYAAARRLAHVHGTDVRIDTSWYRNIPDTATPREYELGYFNISGTEATHSETIGMTGIRNAALKDRPVALWRKLFPRYRFTPERHFHFDESVLRLPDQACLFGYWVSEKYFKDIEGIIRTEFTVKNAPEGRNRELIERMQSGNSVSLHVRRGDYVRDPNVNRIHGACGIDYYSAAIALIGERVDSPQYFVFSDDIEWVRENLPVPEPVEFVNHNRGTKSYEDLRLMSNCRHNIIANSSFSWWGAWLNPNPDKVVIAPERWFNDAPHDTKDVVPESWEKL